MTSNPIIHIDESLLIGQGTRRACYHHPDDPGKCIKVQQAHAEKDLQSIREKYYYEKYSRKKVSFTHLASFYGCVETDHGTGYVFELIKDYDGKVSKSLADLIVEDNIPQASFQSQLDELHEYLIEQEAIVLSDLRPDNLAVQKTSDTCSHLMIIDGMGNSDYIKVCDWFSFARKKKRVRKWDKLMKKINELEAARLKAHA